MDLSLYRKPGRAPVPPSLGPPRRPSWRALRAPLSWTSAGIMLLASGLLVFNWLIVPTFLVTATLPARQLRPEVESLENAISFLILCAPLVALGLALRRVRPLWAGLRRRVRVAYVVALVVAQTLIVAGAEWAVFQSRGGLKLFEPTFLKSSTGPDGRTAYVFTYGVFCGYRVRIATAHALTTIEVARIPRKCDGPEPMVRWNTDGSVDLVDSSGAKLESQENFNWRLPGGC